MLTIRNFKLTPQNSLTSQKKSSMKKILGSIIIITLILGFISCTPEQIEPEEQGTLIGNWDYFSKKTIFSKNGVTVDSSMHEQNPNISTTMQIDEDKIYKRSQVKVDSNIQEVIYSYKHIGPKRLELIVLENNTNGLNPVNEDLTYKFINGSLEFQYVMDNISEQDSGGDYDKIVRTILYNRIP